MINRIIKSDVALKWLEEGNRDYMNSIHNHGDISKEKRMHTHHHGQNPFAVIVACSDSRIIPEAIFMKGIGDLFVIRQAGNVLDDFGLGSIEYAMDHLGCKLVLVLGHTKCGAIQASLEGASDSFIGKIINEIKNSIGNETNPNMACKKNVVATVNKIQDFIINKDEKYRDVLIKGGIYHTSTGHVEIF